MVAKLGGRVSEYVINRGEPKAILAVYSLLLVL